MPAGRIRPLTPLLALLFLLLVLGGCGSTPATSCEPSSVDCYLANLQLFGEKDDEADLENRKAYFFGASGVAFSPDSSLVAVGNRDMVWVADTSSLATKARLGYAKAGHFGGRKSLLFIDNRRLVVGADGAVLIWDLQQRTITDRLPLPGQTYSPRAMAWSPAIGTLAFSLGATGSTVKLTSIDASGFGAVREFPALAGVPAELEFSRDGRYLAAAGDGSGVLVRETAGGAHAGSLPTAGYVNELELFDEQRLLVAGSEIAFWTFVAEQEAESMENPELHGQVTGRVVARVAGGLAIAALLPFAIIGDSGASYGNLVDEYIAWVRENPVNKAQDTWCGRSTTITRDGRLLADVYPGITSEIIRVFDLRSGDLVKSLDPRGESSCAARFSPDGRHLLVTTDTVARLYDTGTWRYRDLDLD